MRSAVFLSAIVGSLVCGFSSAKEEVTTLKYGIVPVIEAGKTIVLEKGFLSAPGYFANCPTVLTAIEVLAELKNLSSHVDRATYLNAILRGRVCKSEFHRHESRRYKVLEVGASARIGDVPVCVTTIEAVENKADVYITFTHGFCVLNTPILPPLRF